MCFCVAPALPVGIPRLARAQRSPSSGGPTCGELLAKLGHRSFVGWAWEDGSGEQAALSSSSTASQSLMQSGRGQTSNLSLVQPRGTVFASLQTLLSSPTSASSFGLDPSHDAVANDKAGFKKARGSCFLLLVLAPFVSEPSIELHVHHLCHSHLRQRMASAAAERHRLPQARGLRGPEARSFVPRPFTTTSADL